MSTRETRPPQVLSAAMFVGMSSAFLLYTLIELLTSWNSLEVQEPLADLFDQAGIGASDGRVESVRIALQVLVVVLVAGLVCAFYTARGDRASRVVVTGVAAVTALVITVIGGLVGILLAAFAVYAVIQLWSPPARRWFAGEPEPATPRADPSMQPFAERHPAGADIPPPPGATRTGAPRAVLTIARVVTLASSVAVVLALGFLATWFGLRDDLATELSRQYAETLSMDVTPRDARLVLDLLAGVSAVAIVLAAVAIVSVRQLLQRSASAPRALLGLSIATIVLGVVVSPVGLVWCFLGVWVIVLLNKPETRLWTAPARR